MKDAQNNKKGTQSMEVSPTVDGVNKKVNGKLNEFDE